MSAKPKPPPIMPVIRGRSIIMNTKILSAELTCPICLDLLTTTMVTKECLHRFCNDCITLALARGNKECPTCRKKLPSKRSLRADTNFDDLIRRIWPDRRKYEEMLAAANQDGDDPLSSIVSFADEGEERNDHPHFPRPSEHDPFDKDAPTPPALHDSRNNTPPLEEYDDGGRKTPPWFTMGDIDPKTLNKRDKKLYVEAQKAYLKLKSRRLGARLTGFERVFDCDQTLDTYSKASRETDSPHEPHTKLRKTNSGGTKKTMAQPDDAKSTTSSADSDPDSDSDDDGARVEAELDREEMEETDLMEPNLFLVKTSKELPVRPKQQTAAKEGTDGQPLDQPGPSTSAVDASQERTLFDPRANPDPPFPTELEQFAELMPNGKGATWQASADNPELQQGEDDLDEELVYDEDDAISVVSIDDLLAEMGPVAHEDEVDALYEQHKPEGDLFPDLSKDLPKDKERDKYMCNDTRLHLRELNELRLGGLVDIKATLEDSQQFDLGESTTWYSQMKEGEEIVYYEKSKQPLPRGNTRRPTAVYDAAAEVSRIAKRITLKDIRDDMSNTDTDLGTPCTLSLKSSEPSSVLTLSDVHEEDPPEEPVPPPVDLPPLDPGKVQERLHRWIGDVAPNTPEHPDTPLDRSMHDESDEDDCESLEENYEIECELRPSAALLSRAVPPEVLQTRFIRTQNDTKIEHIEDYLHLRWTDDIKERLREGEKVPEIPRADHFYVFNRADRHCKYVCAHETIGTAQSLTARDEHVVIYYDTQRAELSAEEMSLLANIVPLEARAEPADLPSTSTARSSLEDDDEA